MRRLTLGFSIAALLGALGGWLYLKKTATRRLASSRGNEYSVNHNAGSEIKGGPDPRNGSVPASGAHGGGGDATPQNSDGSSDPLGEVKTIELVLDGKDPTYNVKPGQSVRLTFPNTREYPPGSTYPDIDVSLFFVAFNRRGARVLSTTLSQLVSWSAKTIELDVPRSIIDQLGAGDDLRVVVVARPLGSSAKSDFQEGKCRIAFEASTRPK